MIRIIGIKLLLILISFLRAEEYFISFQLSSKNYRLIYENFNCSKKLTHTTGKKIFLFDIKCNKNNILKCCYEHKNEIIDKLINSKITITGRDEISNKQNSHAKLTFLPSTFDIIIKDQMLYFYLKEK